MLSNDQNLNSFTEKVLDLYKKQECPLHICVQNGTSHLYYALNDVNQVDQYLNTPLHMAALYNNPDIVERLLERRANPQLQNLLRETPLHIAAVVDKEGFIVQRLLDCQVNLQLQNVEGNTPLHIAVLHKNFKAIERFFNHKHGTEVFINVVNNYGKTPLDLANQNEDVVHFINEQRKNIAYHMVTYPFGLDNCKHFVNNVGIDINNMLLASGSSILTGLVSYCNRPKIYQPTLSKKLRSIRHSIECGARIFKMDGNGESAVSILVGIDDDQRKRSVCDTLEAHKEKLSSKEEELFIKEEKSCIEEMPDGATKEQMRQLLQKWQSGVKLYECLKDIVTNMSALNLVIGERRNANKCQFEEPDQALTTQSILQVSLQRKGVQHNNTHMKNVNIFQSSTSQVCDARSFCRGG